MLAAQRCTMTTCPQYCHWADGEHTPAIPQACSDIEAEHWQGCIQPRGMGTLGSVWGVPMWGTSGTDFLSRRTLSSSACLRIHNPAASHNTRARPKLTSYVDSPGSFVPHIDIPIAGPVRHTQPDNHHASYNTGGTPIRLSCSLRSFLLSRHRVCK